MKTCFFINSSDKTHDIATLFLKGFSKYIINNPLQVYMGVNQKRHKKYKFIHYIEADKTNWRNETLDQLNILKNNFNIKNVILVLDDFILNKEKDCSEINVLLEIFNNKKLKYLSLKRLNESKIINFIESFKKKDIINKLRYSYPYYSSLQIAVWDIDYLIDNIKYSSSIWNFEHLKRSNNHYQVKDDYFSYRHIVEKGDWNYYTPSYVRKYIGDFNPGNRKVKKNFIGFIIFNIKIISFFVFGFLISNLKKKFI